MSEYVQGIVGGICNRNRAVTMEYELKVPSQFTATSQTTEWQFSWEIFSYLTCQENVYYTTSVLVAIYSSFIKVMLYDPIM